MITLAFSRGPIHFNALGFFSMGLSLIFFCMLCSAPVRIQWNCDEMPPPKSREKEDAFVEGWSLMEEVSEQPSFFLRPPLLEFGMAFSVNLPGVANIHTHSLFIVTLSVCKQYPQLCDQY